MKIGCCGFSGSIESYAELFNTVEVQNTFYQPPLPRTLQRWRDSVPKDFEFTLKAWQLITHESNSPTYRRLKRELTEKEAADAGAFRWTPIVRQAWDTTVECAQALSAKRILFQCPASFKPTPDNVRRMRNFFRKLERGEFKLYWEPRGKAWTDDPSLCKSLCDELNLFHAVDPFVSETQTPRHAYFRLHGKTGWRYVYSNEELQQLRAISEKIGKSSYVFFNNITMRKDAAAFKSILSGLNS